MASYLDDERGVLSKCGLGPPIQAVAACPHEHVALAGSEAHAPRGIGPLGDCRVKLGIVVDLEFHTCVGHRFPLGVDDGELYLGRLGIVSHEVHLGVVACLEHGLLGPVIVAKDTCVHEQCPRCRGVEPPQVEHGLGFAGAHKPPLAVGPGLDPGMVVVGVGPAWGVDLPCRNAHCAQCRNGERALLAATPGSRLHALQRRRGARVAGLVGHMLVAPVVHLEYGVFHAQAFHAVFQLLVKHKPGAVERLVVDAQRQHKVHEDVVGYRFPPGHLLAGEQGLPHIGDVEVLAVVGHVAQRGVGVEKVQCLPLLVVQPSLVELEAHELFLGIVGAVDVGTCHCLDKDEENRCRGKESRSHVSFSFR